MSASSAAFERREAAEARAGSGSIQETHKQMPTTHFRLRLHRIRSIRFHWRLDQETGTHGGLQAIYGPKFHSQQHHNASLAWPPEQ